MADTSGLQQLISQRGQAFDKMYEKTLMRWVNAKLQQEGEGPSVDNMSTAWKDGSNLIRLVETLSGKQAPKYHKNIGKKSFLGLENISMAMKMMEDDGLRSDYTARDFQEGNKKAVLSVLWGLVHHYQLQKPFAQGGVMRGGESSKRSLFDWLQNKTSGYPNVSIKDLHNSWFDGLGLLALIDQFDSSILPNNQINNFQELDPSRKRENLDLAFDLAERHLGIPRILDADDILSTKPSHVPNEECFMTYLSFFPQAFLDKEQGRTPRTSTAGTTSTTSTTTPSTTSTTTPSTTSGRGGIQQQRKEPSLSVGTREQVQAPSLIGDTPRGISRAGEQPRQPILQKKGAPPSAPTPPPVSKVEQAKQLTPSTLKHASVPMVTAPMPEESPQSYVTGGTQPEVREQPLQQPQQRQQPRQQPQLQRRVTPPRAPAPPPVEHVPESKQITPEILAESGYPLIVPTTQQEDVAEARRREEALHPAGHGKISPKHRGPRAGARLAAAGGGVDTSAKGKEGKEGKKKGLVKKKKMGKKKEEGEWKKGIPSEREAGVAEGEEQQVIGEATVFEIGRLPDRTELHEQRRAEKLERKRRKQLEREVMHDHLYAPSEEQPLQQQPQQPITREGGLAPQFSPKGKKVIETGERRGVGPAEQQPIGEATVFEIGRIPDITELHEQRRAEKLERKRRKQLEREVMHDHLYAPSEEPLQQQPIARERGVAAEQQPIGEATVFEIGRIPDISELHAQRHAERLEMKRRKKLEREIMTDHLYAPSEEEPRERGFAQPQQRAQQQQVEAALGQKRAREREMFGRPIHPEMLRFDEERQREVESHRRARQLTSEIEADINRIRREARVAEEEARRIEAEVEALRRESQFQQQPSFTSYSSREIGGGEAAAHAAVDAEREKIAHLKSQLARLQGGRGGGATARMGDQQIHSELEDALRAKKRAKSERRRAKMEAAQAEGERHRAEQRRIMAEREKLQAETERLKAEEEKARIESQFASRDLDRLRAEERIPSGVGTSVSDVTPLAETTTTTTTPSTLPVTSVKGKERLSAYEGEPERKWVEAGGPGPSGKYEALPESEARKAQGIRDRPAVGQTI